MAFTQGSPLPDITETRTKVDTAPQYYTDYLSDLAGAGQAAIGRTAAEGISPMDVLQTQGYGMVPGAATAYQPGLTAAAQTASGVAGGLDTGRISALMDPYQRQVVDEMARLQQQNIQRSVLPTMRGAFVGRGDLGSQRYAAATGQTLADMQRNLMGQQYGALSSGYKDAVRAALDEMNLQSQAARTQADIAKQEQELGLTGAGALTKAGAERQAYEQAKLDYPLKQATQAAALMRGFQVPTTQVETFKGPKPGAYETSPLSNITGILATLGSIKPGTAGYNALSYLANKIGKGLSDIGSGFEAGATLIANPAKEGEPGYGWQYYSDGTAIDPQGSYYYQGEKVWSPLWQEGDELAKGGLVGMKRR